MARYRKIITTTRANLVVCDTPKCDFEVPNGIGLKTEDFLNKACPDCGENLLTQEDYDQWLKLHSYIRFINKWFSWITVFIKESEPETAEVHVHNGVKITKLNK